MQFKFTQIKPFIILSILFCVTIFNTAYSLDPSRKITQYIIDSWLVENGLPQSTVMAIYQTKDGYLYLGTEEGLIRYDGVRFTVFNKINTPQIKNNSVRCLLEDSKDNLWIGTYGKGIVKKNRSHFIYDNVSLETSNDIIMDIVEDNNGIVWLATLGNGLKYIKGNTVKTITSKDGLSNDKVLSLFVDKKNNLWIGTYGGGINLYSDGKFINFNHQESLSNEIINNILIDSKNNILIGTRNGIFRITEDDTLYHYTTKDGLSNNMIFVIKEDRDKNIWIGTYGGGLNRFNIDGKILFDCMTSNEGLGSDMIFSLEEDHEGSLWIGTSNGGLNRIRVGKFNFYTSKDGLSNNFINSVFKDNQDGLWIGTMGKGLNYYKDGKNYVFNTNNGLVCDMILSICIDRHNVAWIGTINGLSRIENKKITNYSIKDGLPENMVTSIIEDDDGTLWLGTINGLCKYKNNSFQKVLLDNKQNYLWSLCKGKSGKLFIGTRGSGLICLADDKITKFTIKDGLCSNYIASLYEDNDENLWIGTIGGGLSLYKKDKFYSFTSDEGLYDDTAMCIIEDDENNIWMTCNKGIHIVNKLELLRSIRNGSNIHIENRYYNISDGMLTSECNGGTYPSGWICKDADGKVETIYFPTAKGLHYIHPHRIVLNDKIPKVNIEEIYLDGETIDPMSPLEFNSNFRNLTIKYTALSLLYPKNVYFKYKLIGLDKSFSEKTLLREVTYINLTPGEYTFKVIACNNDGLWNEIGSSYTFTVLPIFSQTYLFLGLVIFGIILFGFIVTYFINLGRQKRLTQRHLELEKKVYERARELKVAQENAQRDMEMAINVQASFYPKSPPISKDWEVAFIFRPLLGISGDLYDFYELGGRFAGLGLFDVSGHGIASALITMIARSIIFRGFREHQNDSLESAIQKINANLINEIGNTGNFLTGILLKLQNNHVEYINAAHPYLVYKSAKTGNASIIGLDEDIRGTLLGVKGLITDYKSVTFEVSKGDILLLCTDGLLESRNSDNVQYGYPNLLHAMENAPDVSSKEIINYLLSECYKFIGNHKFSDDLTMILLKRIS